jgi:hypothetical protein
MRLQGESGRRSAGPRAGRRGPLGWRTPFRRPFRWYRGRWSRWLLMESAILLWFGGPAAHKLDQKDAQRIERDTGMSITDLTEREVVDAVRRLGITKLGLTDDDIDALNAVEAEGL